jgi:hypothetical protein
MVQSDCRVVNINAIVFCFYNCVNHGNNQP